MQIVEKLEITVHEYHIKIEDLNRTVVDMTSQKQKLLMESQEVKICTLLPHQDSVAKGQRRADLALCILLIYTFIQYYFRTYDLKKALAFSGNVF
jgi:hypothetical protein